MRIDQLSLADGKDGTVVNVTVVDKKGRPVPDAMNSVAFKIAGAGRIIGVGNGDPSSHEADIVANQQDYKRSLFNGKCQVILQSGDVPGVIQLEATSPGLQNGSVSITTKQ